MDQPDVSRTMEAAHRVYCDCVEAWNAYKDSLEAEHAARQDAIRYALAVLTRNLLCAYQFANVEAPSCEEWNRKAMVVSGPTHMQRPPCNRCKAIAELEQMQEAG